jgi:lysophospholipase
VSTELLIPRHTLMHDCACHLRPSFSGHQQPFPIVVADSISSKEDATYNMPDGFGVPISNPMYEFNPCELIRLLVFCRTTAKLTCLADEFGSYDPMLSSFVPMKYMGSTTGKCVTGFDQLSYVQAISSNVFNGAESDVVNKLVTAFKALDSSAGSGILAAQIPNPFKGLSHSTYIESDDDVITLGDGGLDGQEIPLQPLLVKGRGVDVIVALDLVSISFCPFARDRIDAKCATGCKWHG